jgi:hypothetical protein
MNDASLKLNRRRWRRRAAAIAFAFLALNWYLVAAADVVPPDEQTKTGMALLEQRVRLAVAQKLDIPADLTDLPLIAGKASEANDAWGHPIVLDRIGDHVTLISYGKDGRPGGTAHSADIVHRFTLAR